MNAVKIIRILALALAVVAAFVADIPYAGLGLVILGAANGFMGVTEDRRLIYLVTAGVLSIAAGAWGSVPAVGEYLTAIFTNVSTVLNAGVLSVVVMIIKDRITE